MRTDASPAEGDSPRVEGTRSGDVVGNAEPIPIAKAQKGASVGPIEFDENDLVSGHAVELLLAEYRRHHPKPAEGDVAAIERAAGEASRAHAEQRRRSGEPYLVHPMRVAMTLAKLGLDAVSIVAGLLHDAVEDSEMTVFDVHERFGREVASIVDGVTKLGKVPYLSRQEQQAESFRKLLLAMSEDIRVLLVKLIDRLDNMRTLGHLPPDKQERVSRETMQIYAPLAGRLGIEWVRRELQDLSFRYLEPSVYAATKADIDRFMRSKPGIVDATVASLRSAFDAEEAPDEHEPAVDDDEPLPVWSVAAHGEVSIRATLRPPFRVQRRLEPTGRRPDQLSDVATFQVVTRDRASCYAALGQLHAHFQPVPGRFRDYIALPRPNRYRALHTSVIDRNGQRIEVQIRSETMDAIAERGIVAHWEDGTVGSRRSRSLRWLGQLMDWQQDVSDPHEFIEAVKADLFADEVYVFSPEGDIFTFPKGATPIDFAFAIHTDVGMTCSGARVNGHLVPLRYRLRQGDTVEILTNPSVGPREEWLKMCVSSRARARIKHYLRQRERGRLRSLGRSLVEQEVASRGMSLAAFESNGEVATLPEALGLSKDVGIDGVYEAVGAGQIAAEAIATRLHSGPPQREEKGLFTRVLRRMTRGGRRDEGLGAEAGSPIVLTEELVEGGQGRDATVTLAPCCSPLPGDALIGFFEPGRGIVAHVEGCPEALEHLSERKVHLAWAEGLALDRPVTLEVRTANTVGLLAEMSRAFSHHGVNIKQANCRAYGDGDRAINTFQASVASLPQLQSLVGTLKNIEGVIGVERVFTRSGTYPHG